MAGSLRVLGILGVLGMLALPPATAQGLAAPKGERFTTQRLVLSTDTGRMIPLDAELALTPAQRTQGLKYRTTLADGAGMLFVFDRDQILSFWMQDTAIPLSIAFISAEGRILEIQDMTPFDVTSIQSSRSARFALEVPQGWFDRQGIRPGALCRVIGEDGRSGNLRTLLDAS